MVKAMTKRRPCKIWTGSTREYGYGRVWYQGRYVSVHRLTFFQIHGWWPPVVMHTCDNPPCYEGTHLVAGTQATNNADRAAKGRNGNLRGEHNGQAKITEATVRQVRARCSSGEYQRDVAAALGISQAQVSNIMRGKKWGHVK